MILMSVPVFAQSDNDYFFELSKEISHIQDHPEKIKMLYKREIKKLRQTNDFKFLISSRYIQLFFYLKEPLQQIPLTYELLSINDNRYPFISIACNFSLALKFEKYSPKLAMQYIDKAITENEKLGKRYMLPHIYHAKGRFFFNASDYQNAKLFFEKALKLYDSGEKLYIASMYNNFALIDEKLNSTDSAIKNLEKGIEILKNDTLQTKEKKIFLDRMTGNLGYYYFKTKEYRKAEELLLQEFNSNKKNFDYSRLIKTSQHLCDLYYTTLREDKILELITFLKEIEPKLENISDKITLNEIIRNYYFTQNDLIHLKLYSKKIEKLNHIFNEENSKKIQILSDTLNHYLVKSIDEKYEFNEKLQKKKFNFSLIIGLIILFTSIIIIISLINRNKSQKEISLQKNIILEKNINLYREKIKYLQQSIFLKMEAEKIFIDNLREIKKEGSINPEKLIKHSFLKINKLMEIDIRNFDLISESYAENEEFLINLSAIYPQLTNKEKKLCIYFRMDLSSKEIAALENTSEGTVRVYKTKIRNKMTDDKDISLHTLLNKV
ncbi:tetratricopeptide repeat protein [Chryseobacterium kwangjuense]|nr:LuxR C-terminal-related transcriptional regulator [Chryseobacterium kwangjuense]